MRADVVRKFTLRFRVLAPEPVISFFDNPEGPGRVSGPEIQCRRRPPAVAATSRSCVAGPSCVETLRADSIDPM